MAYSTISKPSLHFNTKLWTGNGGTQSITGVGFQPDFTWIKERSETRGHNLTDAVRGAPKYINSATTDAEVTSVSTTLTSFDSDGFSLGSYDDVNKNSQTYVGWNWKANGAGSANTDGSISSTVSASATSGFSIVKWTGSGSAATIGHGLGSGNIPKMIIVKNLSDSVNWMVYHNSVVTASATNKSFMTLNTTDALGTNGSATTFTSVSDTTFGVGTDNIVNGSGDNMIAYCFEEKAGYSKFGSYVGNGNADGTFIYTGFAPKFVLLKITSGSDGWWLVDDKQANPYPNPNVQMLVANTTPGDNTSVSPFIDIYSNGFKLKSTWSGVNGSGSSYIYMAIGQSLVGSNNVPCTAR